LFESGSHKLCDKNILVTSTEELKIKRVVLRDNISAEAVKARMDKQLSEVESLKLADFVIVNDEERLLIPQVLELHEKFTTGP